MKTNGRVKGEKMSKKRLNIAVIGCSGMAEGHMYGITDNKEFANLYAICDIDTL